MGSGTTRDEHGRLVSDDGWYVWTGEAWALRSAEPPPSAIATMPPPGPVATTGTRADVEAEAATYTGTRRLQRGGVRALNTQLAADEALLATAVGTVQKAPGLALAGGLLVGAMAQRMLVVAPTDRRLLLCIMNATGRQVDAAVPMAYDEISMWAPELSRMGSALRVGADEDHGVYAFQFARDKLERVDAVVRPFLRPGTGPAAGS